MSDEGVETSGNTNSSVEESVESTAGKGTSEESDIAKGLSSIISSVITLFDSRAQQTILSQHQLSSSIDRLTRGNPLFTVSIFNYSLCPIDKIINGL